MPYPTLFRSVSCSRDRSASSASRAERMQHAAEHVGGARDGGDAAFTLDARAEQFEIECAFIAGAEHPFEHRADRDGPVAWPGAARRLANAVAVITDLDEAAPRYGAPHRYIGQGYRRERL